MNDKDNRRLDLLLLRWGLGKIKMLMLKVKFQIRLRQGFIKFMHNSLKVKFMRSEVTF
jgi:hypothetical protein